MTAAKRPVDLDTCLESEFTAWVTGFLELDGAVIIPLVGGEKVAGWPDRLIYHRSWHGLIEFKRHTGKVSARQAHNIRNLCKRQPGYAVVLRAGEPLCSCEDADGAVLFRWADAHELVAGLVELAND